MKLIILSGLSGSGKSVALHTLEDLGYYCIDNIPAGVLRNFIRETVATRNPAYSLMAVGVDARNRPEDIHQVPSLARELRANGVDCQIIFLHADEETLLARYSETRRKHPLSGPDLSLRDAIARERSLLSAIKDEADLTIDTTGTNIHQLREMVRDRVHEAGAYHTSLLFESFGYKRGIPPDADFVFDVRCLPNPHWDEVLRPLTGRDAAVIDFLGGQDSVRQMEADLTRFLDSWLPAFEQSSRSYVTVAIGCTGGRHRSVYMVERLAAHFRADSKQVLVRHNELTGEG
ncbi:MAG: RNase adapter RapZ [Gammaproteobacteria bacterium]